jgi:hypothetical protein
MRREFNTKFLPYASGSFDTITSNIFKMMGERVGCDYLVKGD